MMTTGVRYVSENSGQSSYTFSISSSRSCGSVMGQIPGDSSRTQLVNTIIIQNDKEIQEIWDVARSISCDWVDNYIKTVNFNPFTVGMLQSKEVRFQGDQPIECWMDLQLGKWPEVSNINSIVKIGDPLSLLVYARDNEFQYDVAVKDCYAFAGPDYDDPNTPRLQLTDKEGCVIKDKLISQFYAAREEDDIGSVIVTYAFVHAFKFPDVMDVFMTCNVEICKGDCDQKCSAAVPRTTTEAPRRSGSTLFGEPIYTTKPTTVRIREPKPTSPPPPKPKCYPGSNDPGCPTTPRYAKELFPSNCIPGSNDPNCITNINIPIVTRKPPRCYPGSRNPHCQKKCYPNSKDPRCKPPAPPTVPPTTRFKCYTGSRDPRCPQPTTTSRPICYRGSRDPSCPPVCDNISKDPRCRKPDTSNEIIFECVPGSRDPRCPQIKTTSAPPVTQKDKCFPGSLNPECETATKDGRYGSILFPATITTTPSTTPVEVTKKFYPITVPFTVPTTTTRRPPPVTTTTQKPRGGAIFGLPSTTRRTPVKPKLKPKTTTTKSPGRGKQLNEPKSNPEPTGKAWEGESRYHAFHSFHFQRGDGRRSRVFGQRITPKTSKRSKRRIRSVTEISNPRPFVGKLPLKLSRSLHVVSPIDYSISSMEETIIPTSGSPSYVCLSFVSVSGFSLVFFLLIITLVIFLFLYIRQRKIRNFKQ